MRMVQSQDDDASQRREEEVKLQEGRKTSRKARVKVNAMTRRKTRMRPRSPRPVTNPKRSSRDGRTDVSWGPS